MDERAQRESRLPPKKGAPDHPRRRQVYRNPQTQDPLSLGGYISYQAQRQLRKWRTLGLISLATFCCWAVSTLRPDLSVAVLLWWNLAASYLALVIESVVGIGQFEQTYADAAVLREVQAISKHNEQLALVYQQQLAYLAQLSEMNQRQLDHLEQVLQRSAAIAEVLDQHINVTAKEHSHELATVKDLTIRVHQLTTEVHGMTNEVQTRLREQAA